MRYSVFLLLLVTGTALAGPAVDGVTSATGSSGGSRRTPTQIQDDAFRRAREAGRLIMFVYAEESPTTAQGRAKGFLTTQTTRSTTNQFVMASIYITPDDDLYDRCRDAIDDDSAPYWFLVTPDGDFVAGGGIGTVGNDGNGSWKRAVSDVAATHPPIGPQDRRAIAGALRTGQTKLDEGDYEAVARLVPRLRAVWYTTELAEQASALCEAFDAKVEELLAEPTQLVDDGEILQAAQAYAQLVETFSDRTETGQQIQGTLEALLEEYPEVRGQMNGQSARPNDPPTSPPADDDPPQEVQPPAPVDDEPASDADQAQSLLQLARMYHNREMTDKAKAKLQECIEQYPHTQGAREAESLLEQW